MYIRFATTGMHLSSVCLIWATIKCHELACHLWMTKAIIWPPLSLQWTSYQIRNIAGCACVGNAGNVFPTHRLQRKPLVSDPGMHHCTYVTHVPWCMSGSLTCGGRMRTRNFTYLVRGPWRPGQFCDRTGLARSSYALCKLSIKDILHVISNGIKTALLKMCQQLYSPNVIFMWKVRQTCLTNSLRPHFTWWWFTVREPHSMYLKRKFSIRTCKPMSFVSKSATPKIHKLCARFSWWRHQLETSSELLVLCQGISPVCWMFIVATQSGSLLDPSRLSKAIIGSDIGMSLIRHPADVLPTEPLRIHQWIFIKINQFSFKKISLNILSTKWQPFCPGLDVSS